MSSHINYTTNRRRSVRTYASDKITPEVVQDILECGLRAPTSKNNRGTFFVLVEESSVLEALADCKPNAGKFIAKAPLAIVVCSDSEKSGIPYIDCAVATSFMQLAVTDNGLGSCWCQIEGRKGTKLASAEEQVKELLGLPTISCVLCILAVGELTKADDIKERNLSLEWERVHVGSYRGKKE